MSIKIISHDKTKGSSRLELSISGKDINCIIVNTLRRMILSDVPIYAFTNFTFNKNTSVFHNNFIKNQIKNIPVWGINNKLEYYEQFKSVNVETKDEIEEIDDNVELSVDKKVDSNSLDQLTMYVDYENKSSDVYSVTTNDAKFYFSQKNIDNPYPHPIQLVKLQPKQAINFSVVTSIGIEKDHSMFSPVSICVYEEKSPTEFRFILESRGQLPEEKIINIAILNLIKKLEDILEKVTTSVHDTDLLIGDVQFNNEDHTLGNLLTSGLQQHPKIQFAGYHMPHPLENRVIISYKLKSGKFKEIFKDVVDDFIKLYKKINKF